jgi:3-deoxy-manno-octulosonate cytidylyltransferase (CMP-KDO synthetase)
MADMTRRKVLAVIPARFNSTRFPGKVLAPLGGKPMVAHTYAQTVQAKLVTDVVVATDDQRVQDALEPLGIPVVMTRSDHPSGTDRIAEVARKSDAEIIVNVQGDEPLIDPETIDDTVRPLIELPEIPMATARRRLVALDDIRNPNIVKVVCAQNGQALYFSRCPIPYIREAADRAATVSCYWQHIGIYVYRRDFLLCYSKMLPTPMEQLERLEQLRVLENGYSIMVVDTKYVSLGVDTPEDLERVRALFEGARKEELV